MLEALAQARLWLANLDPAAPAVTLMLGVFLTIYSIRRWFPRVWLLVEKTVPVVDAIDYRPAATILWKAWQAWPAALLGAVTSALATGGSVSGALKGAALGLAVAVIHELAAAYKGKLGGPPKPPNGARGAGLTGGVSFVLTLVLACGLPGCSVFGPGGSVWPAVARCAPSERDLIDQVAAILLAGGDYKAALLERAKTTTKEAIVCAVQAAVDELASKVGASPARMSAASRGNEFLAETGNK
jgi:hypothetical protein